MRARTLIGSALALIAAAAALSSCTQSASSITSSRYALVYGIKDYPGTINDLNYTVNDADSMTTLLKGEGWTVTEHTNSAATEAQIAQDIADLNSISSDSTFLIYYSGHGTISGSTTYILPYDSIISSGSGSTETAELNSANMISPSALSTMLASLPTKNVLVVFDSCYSGGFASSGSAADASPADYTVSRTSSSYSAFSTAMSKFGELLVSNAAASGSKTPIVLSAAGSEESSVETSSLAHGVFTYYLLEAATKGDSDGDGYVTMTEAYEYTAAKLKAWDQTEGSAAFLPHLSGGTRDLVLFTD
jgi:uncharacterized caspase-like protein